MNLFVKEPTLPYLERSPRGSSADRAPLVVLLHGRGAEAKTIFSIQGMLDSRFHVLAITAPYPSAIGGWEWFQPHAETGDGEIGDANRFGEAEAKLTSDLEIHIERLKAKNSPLFLWGFSQGAAMALIIGLRGTIKTTGIVPMSGFLPSPIETRWKHWNTAVHALIAHGSNDEVLPPASSRHTQAFLESKGIPTEYYEYKGPHKMSLNAIAYINNWILRLSGLEPISV